MSATPNSVLLTSCVLKAAARHFKEEDIDEFRECFSLYARGGSGQIRTLDQLTVIMRSLGMSPTIAELKKYFKEKGGSLSFPDFLDVLHEHGSRQQSVAGEILAAFRATDTSRSGTISAQQLRHTLLHWGERLSAREVDQIFREANIHPGGHVRYEDFTKIVCAPVPDYY